MVEKVEPLEEAMAQQSREVARINAELEKRNAQLEWLALIQSALSQASDEEEILTAITLGVDMDQLPSRISLQYLEMDESGCPIVLWPVAIWHDGIVVPDHPELHQRREISDFPTSELWFDPACNPVFISDVQADPRVDEQTPERAAPPGFQAIVVMSLRSGGRWHGLVTFLWLDPHAFSPEERFYFRRLLEPVAAVVGSRRAYLAQRESEERFRSLYADAPNAYFSVGPDNLIRRCNRRAGELLGCTVDDLVGRSALDLYADTPQGKSKASQMFQRFLNGEMIVGEELQMERVDGTPVWVSLSVNADRDHLGRIVESRSMAVDITERKRAEEALAWEASVNAALAELSQALIAQESLEEISDQVLDHAQRLTDSVSGYVGYVDLQSGHLVCSAMTRDVRDVRRVEGKDIALETLSLWSWGLDHCESLLTNEPASDPRSSGMSASHVPIRNFVSAPAMIGEELVGQVALANANRDYEERDLALVERLADIYALAVQRSRAVQQLKAYSDLLEDMVDERTEELREAQEQLIRREKLTVMGQLAGGVGHELRTPLGAIKNAAYFLKMVLDASDPEIQEMLEILEREVGRSEAIINSLLDFARTKTPTRRRTDINALVREVLSHIEIPDEIETSFQFAAPLPPLYVDPDQLQRVFGNLITNAIQAMPEGGQLTVETSKVAGELLEPDEIVVSVADTGVGISEENQERIFEPLFTTKAKGIGLGLAIVKTLVEGHGGTVAVESEKDRGSTFFVSFPTNSEKEGLA